MAHASEQINFPPCGRPCVRPEGCRIHWKTKPRFPCAVCGKPTGLSSGRCQSHIGSYYQNRSRRPYLHHGGKQRKVPISFVQNIQQFEHCSNEWKDEIIYGIVK
ncbi:hypothetical protein C1646_747562 [Rhizophagus diaphanus]|nr:hypothetical protein C1646_747562 [Rhizophagus diaphanus] [Rhizophagus sp. MUCL 43196]